MTRHVFHMGEKFEVVGYTGDPYALIPPGTYTLRRVTNHFVQARIGIETGNERSTYNKVEAFGTEVWSDLKWDEYEFCVNNPVPIRRFTAACDALGL